MDNQAEELLLKHGVKPTSQRVVITDYLVNTHCHPTADEVFQAVSSSLPVALSRATVYNTLNVLVEAGVVIEVVVEPGKSRYDANTKPHHHFVDLTSGEVHDLMPEEIDSLPLTLRKSRLSDQFTVSDYHITFFGKKKTS